MNEPGRTVGEVGELALVERILEIVGGPGAAGGDVLVGPGDDAAVLACRGNVVLTTDSQHEDVHFRRDWMGAEMLGRRAIAVNASDLGAMGARPTGFLVALALPPETPLDWVEDLAAGLRQGAERVSVAIVGGDVAGVPDRVSITVTAVGVCPEGSACVRRSGARPGDRIYATGHPGRASAGRRLLRAGYRLGAELSPHAEVCVLAFLDPVPPVELGGELARCHQVGAMMDISDGIALDLARMCRASDAGAMLQAATLMDDPILERVAADFGIDARACVLGGGDDYELLCAVGEKDDSGFRATAGAAGIEVRPIGWFIEGAPRLVLEHEGGQESLAESGWDHFAT